jgi:hypothetical protein
MEDALPRGRDTRPKTESPIAPNERPAGARPSGLDPIASASPRAADTTTPSVTTEAGGRSFCLLGRLSRRRLRTTGSTSSEEPLLTVASRDGEIATICRDHRQWRTIVFRLGAGSWRNIATATIQYSDGAGASLRNAYALSNLAAPGWDDWIARTMRKPDGAKLPRVVALLL